jgi:uncharacterized protein
MLKLRNLEGMSFLIWGIVALFLTFKHVSAAEDDEIVKVVYHADFSDPKRFSAMLTSVNNMTTYYESKLLDYDVRIVFISHGIRFLIDDKLADTPFAEDALMAERRESNKGRLMSLKNMMSVKLELCGITQSAVKLETKQFYPGTQIVPSGVVRIAELQNQGFAYLKV